MRDLLKLRTRNIVVRIHPEVGNALVVDAVIINGADFAQPFPTLELTFKSMDGRLIASRRFQPAEYLAGELAGAQEMVPNTPVKIELEIEDPGAEAVNYFLSFR